MEEDENGGYDTACDVQLPESGRADSGGASSSQVARAGRWHSRFDEWHVCQVVLAHGTPGHSGGATAACKLDSGAFLHPLGTATGAAY